MACICAVAVQEGNTVLGVDACDFYKYRNSDAFAPYIVQYSKKTEHGAAIYRDETGRKFAVSYLSLYTLIFLPSSYLTSRPPVSMRSSPTWEKKSFLVHLP